MSTSGDDPDTNGPAGARCRGCSHLGARRALGRVEVDDDRPRSTCGLACHEVEGARVSGAQRHPQARKGAVEQSLVGDPPGVVSQLLTSAEPGAHMDGFIAIRLPRDPDRAVGFDEHRLIVRQSTGNLRPAIRITLTILLTLLGI
jgi:hypothetical protein